MVLSHYWYDMWDCANLNPSSSRYIIDFIMTNNNIEAINEYDHRLALKILEAF